MKHTLNPELTACPGEGKGNSRPLDKRFGCCPVVAGALEHSDSLGNRAVLNAGGVHRRWLGWDSEHQDKNASATELTEFIQLWLQTARPDGIALDTYTHYATEDRFERWLQIVRSECSPSDGLMMAQDAPVHVARLDSTSRRIEHPFEPGHGGYMYVIEGHVEANLELLRAGDAARVMSEGRLRVKAFTPRGRWCVGWSNRVSDRARRQETEFPSSGQRIVARNVAELAKELVALVNGGTAEAAECVFGSWAGRKLTLADGKGPEQQQPLVIVRQPAYAGGQNLERGSVCQTFSGSRRSAGLTE